MPSTTNGFPYPSLSGANNPPSDIQALAEATDTAVTFLKSGVRSITTLTSNSSSTSSTTELTVATISSVTLDGSTPVELTFSFFSLSKTVSGDVFQLRIYRDTTQIGAAYLGTSDAGNVVRVVVTPSAGTYNFTARLVRTSGTGTAQVVATSTAPACFTVNQVN